MLNNRPLYYFEALAAFVAIFLILTPFQVHEGSKIYVLAEYGIVAWLLLFCVFVSSSYRTPIRRDVLLGSLAVLLICGTMSFSSMLVSFSSYVLLSVSMLSGLLIYLYVSSRALFVKRVIQTIIVVNVLALFSQVAFFHISGEIIGYHTMIFPFSEDKGGVVSKLAFARYTGLYNEPGTYGTWMAISIISLLSIERRASLVAMCGAVSLPFTMSVSAFIYFLLILCAVAFSRTRRVGISRGGIEAALFLIVLCSVLAYYGLFDYLYWRFFEDSAHDGTTSLKLIAIDYIFDQSPSRILLGSGFYINDCVQCESMQDVGLAFNLFFYLGVFSIPVFLSVFLILRPRNVFNYVGILVIFLSKAVFPALAVWFFIFFVRAVNEKSSDLLRHDFLVKDHDASR